MASTIAFPDVIPAQAGIQANMRYYIVGAK